jgi:hypothetical protein
MTGTLGWGVVDSYWLAVYKITSAYMKERVKFILAALGE